MREPKKVRTIAELIKSCRMLREHNEKLKGRNSELEARLEISPDHDVDGIEARDETIKLLDDRIAELEAELTIKLLKDRIEELEARLEFKQKNTDALIARWEPYIEQLEDEIKKANNEFGSAHCSIDIAPLWKSIAKLKEASGRDWRTLQAIRELPEKWRKEESDHNLTCSYYDWPYLRDGENCADELEALLPEKDDGS